MNRNNIRIAVGLTIVGIWGFFTIRNLSKPVAIPSPSPTLRPVMVATATPSPSPTPYRYENRQQPRSSLLPEVILAALDDNAESAATYMRLLDLADDKCIEDREKVADMVVRSVQILKQGGHRATHLDMLNGLVNATQGSSSQEQCSDVLGAIVVMVER